MCDDVSFITCPTLSICVCPNHAVATPQELKHAYMYMNDRVKQLQLNQQEQVKRPIKKNRAQICVDLARQRKAVHKPSILLTKEIEPLEDDEVTFKVKVNMIF